MNSTIGTLCAIAPGHLLPSIIVFQAPRATRAAMQLDQPYSAAIISTLVYH
jgi:hypothetical protein